MASNQKNARSLDFRGPDGRVSFAQNLFKAQPSDKNDPTSKKKFGCTMIWPKGIELQKIIPYGDDGRLMSMEEIVAMVIQEQWGSNGLSMAAKGLIKSPFLAGDGKEARSKKTGDLHPGMGPDVTFMRLQSGENSPPFVSASRYEKIPATVQDVYSGCYGFPAMNFFAWEDSRNGCGVSGGVSVFYKIKDGDRLGGTGGPDPDKFLDKRPDNAGNAPEGTRTGGGAGSLFGAGVTQN